jgi:UDP-N-acetylmuramoylalanine--D-glutamate ligase
MISGATMTATRYAEMFPDLNGARVLVVGAGKSGRAAARLAYAHGASVTLADRRDVSGLGDAVSTLAELGVRLHPGGHPPELLEETNLVVLSPGVAPGVDIVAEAHTRGIPVWGEVELAARFTAGRVIGITGSNGKSTVTAMTGAILRSAGIAGGTGGNLDTPLAGLLDRDAPDAVHALELSSFQLESIETFRPSVAVVLNLSPDHLDRHRTLDAYAAAKARIFENQSDDDFAVLNADDAPSRRFDSAVRADLHWISTRSETAKGAFLRNGRLVLRTGLGEEQLLSIDALALAGAHNLSNALAAALAARLAGAPLDAIDAVLSSFEPLAHRLERVGTIREVAFYNDSKATNPAATLPALDAFAAGTIHLIVGGKDKGGDWDALVDAVRERVRSVLVIGADPAPMMRRFADAGELLECGTLERAVETAFANAAAGDVILLSPACASFDQFDDFEQRGETFRRAVGALGERHA